MTDLEQKELDKLMEISNSFSTKKASQARVYIEENPIVETMILAMRSKNISVSNIVKTLNENYKPNFPIEEKRIRVELFEARDALPEREGKNGKTLSAKKAVEAREHPKDSVIKDGFVIYQGRSSFTPDIVNRVIKLNKNK